MDLVGGPSLGSAGVSDLPEDGGSLRLLLLGHPPSHSGPRVPGEIEATPYLQNTVAVSFFSPIFGAPGVGPSYYMTRTICVCLEMLSPPGTRT